MFRPFAIGADYGYLGTVTIGPLRRHQGFRSSTGRFANSVCLPPTPICRSYAASPVSYETAYRQRFSLQDVFTRVLRRTVYILYSHKGKNEVDMQKKEYPAKYHRGGSPLSGIQPQYRDTSQRCRSNDVPSDDTDRKTQSNVPSEDVERSYHD